MCTNIALLVQNFTYFRVGLKLGRKRPGMVFSRWVLRHESSAHHPLKVGLGILQITSAKRCPLVWPWVGRSLFSTNFVEFDQAV